MGTIVTVDFQNGTATDAGVMNSNFAAVKTVVNGGLTDSNIQAGADIAVAKLDPSATENDVLTTVGGVAVWQAPAASGGGSTTIPVGAGMEYYGATAPSGWLFCDGSAVSRTTYATLFAAIGTVHGSGDGSTTFNLPDRRGRVGVGLNSSGPNEVNALGDNDGRAVANRSISHYHSVGFLSYQMGSNNVNPFGRGDFSPSTSTATSSGDTNNPNYPAYLVCNYIIYSGV